MKDCYHRATCSSVFTQTAKVLQAINTPVKPACMQTKQKMCIHVHTNASVHTYLEHTLYFCNKTILVIVSIYVYTSQFQMLFLHQSV